jgi:hypothetical protein
MPNKILSVIPFALCLAACNTTGESTTQKQKSAEDDLTSARVEAQKKVENAEAKADQLILKANADFAKSVADYRAVREKDLADADRDISDMSTKMSTLRADKQTALSSALISIRAQRAHFAELVGSLDKATPATFDATKALIDKAHDDLTASIRKAE